MTETDYTTPDEIAASLGYGPLQRTFTHPSGVEIYAYLKGRVLVCCGCLQSQTISLPPDLDRTEMTMAEAEAIAAAMSAIEMPIIERFFAKHSLCSKTRGQRRS